MDRYPSKLDAGISGKDSPPSDGFAHLSIDADAHYQTLEGFGAAVAWYAETFAAFPDGSPVYDLAFRDLGLDIIRFRNRYGRQDKNNSSDITAEARILQQATLSLGHAPKVLLSSWSPPGSLKASGLENCSNDKTTCTLAKDSSGQFVYDQFATYFVNALKYYAASGIRPDYLSIQNEPDYVPNGWEGCYFLPSESANYPGYDRALSAVHSALGTTSAAPRFIGPESYSLSSSSLGSFQMSAIDDLLYGIAHHMYQSNYWRTPDNYLVSMQDADSASNGLPLLETEFDAPGDNNTSGGFETAWVMHNALAVEGVSAFLYWSLVWPGTTTQTPGGLIWLTYAQDPTQPPNYAARAQYYAVRHFARFTDPGFVRVSAQSNSNDVRASAYLSPDASQLTIVVLNVGVSDAQVKIDAINNFTAAASETYMSIFREGDAGTSEYWNDLGTVKPNLPLTMPSQSVATLVLYTDTPDAQ